MSLSQNVSTQLISLYEFVNYLYSVDISGKIYILLFHIKSQTNREITHQISEGYLKQLFEIAGASLLHFTSLLWFVPVF